MPGLTAEAVAVDLSEYVQIHHFYRQLRERESTKPPTHLRRNLSYRDRSLDPICTELDATHLITLDIGSGALGCTHRSSSILLAAVCLHTQEDDGYVPLHAAVALVPAGQAEHRTQFKLPLSLPAGCSLEQLYCGFDGQPTNWSLGCAERRKRAGSGPPNASPAVRRAGGRKRRRDGGLYWSSSREHASSRLLRLAVAMSAKRMFGSILPTKDVKFGCFPLTDGASGRLQGQLRLWRSRVVLRTSGAFAAFSRSAATGGPEVTVEAAFLLCPVVSLEEGTGAGVHGVGQAFFLSCKGALLAQQPILDWRCPVGGCLMRCRNALALEQHLGASHEYLECWRRSNSPTRHEFYLRPKPAYFDGKGVFVPGDLLHPPPRHLARLLVTSFWGFPFVYHCSRSARARRWQAGRLPLDGEEVEYEAAAKTSAPGQAGQGSCGGRLGAPPTPGACDARQATPTSTPGGRGRSAAGQARCAMTAVPDSVEVVTILSDDERASSGDEIHGGGVAAAEGEDGGGEVGEEEAGGTAEAAGEEEFGKVAVGDEEVAGEAAAEAALVARDAVADEEGGNVAEAAEDGESESLEEGELVEAAWQEGEISAAASDRWEVCDVAEEEDEDSGDAMEAQEAESSGAMEAQEAESSGAMEAQEGEGSGAMEAQEGEGSGAMEEEEGEGSGADVITLEGEGAAEEGRGDSAPGPAAEKCRTYVPLTEEELNGWHDSDDETDDEEWEAATRQTLATSTELDADEQEFALLWNVWLRVHKLYRDADMADTCRAFFAHYVDLQADTPMRRCFVSHLLMLWSYRLLSPEDVQREEGAKSRPVSE
ncbi:hypothetical protein F751_3968 [Auxenochlorella protothecoides]|uniref:Polycomb protein VEFS-Box domain-containing protein n=1 Tax=Auxenochlorella protothecoides TaxID=3075 RepID=A0A087SHT4_AUXPR|nr:hypothetical protein F751_3968 [Auxenochlorella protothecoides]KFM25288.1 hypothetical protein F751_3968 [Auxenochlorella protothecoides]